VAGRLIGIAVISTAVGIGAGVLATRALSPPVTLDATAVDYHRCPGGAAPIGAFHRGDRVFAVATDSAGHWVAVRSPQGDSEIVWIDRDYLVADADLADLPTASCPDPTPNTTIASGSTTIPDTTTTSSASTTTSAATATTADTTPPVITALTSDPAEVFEEYLSGSSACIDDATAAIQITTSGGATGVTVRFTVLGDVLSVDAAGGSGDWTAILGPYPYGHLPVPNEGADITVTAMARDAAGNETSATIVVRLHSAAECIG
jgi:uncharacterized protein YjdB